MSLATQTARGLPLPAELETAEIDGAKLAYLERGSGEPVVLVHGSISDLTIWEPQLGPVSESYRAIAYSRRYAWPNEDLPAGATDMMAPHVDDLLACLSTVGAYPAHLVGNSWGAFICLRAAMKEPAAARSLILEEPPLVPLITGAPTSPRQIVRSLLRHPLATLACLRFAAGTVAPVTKLIKNGDVDASITRFAQGVLGKHAFDALPQEVRAHMRANASTHVGQALADGGFEPITEPDIASITTPALVLSGANSPAMFRQLAGLLASLLPNGRMINVPRASHAMHIQNPTAVNDVLLRFLAHLDNQ